MVRNKPDEKTTLKLNKLLLSAQVTSEPDKQSWNAKVGILGFGISLSDDNINWYRKGRRNAGNSMETNFLYA